MMADDVFVFAFVDLTALGGFDEFALWHANVFSTDVSNPTRIYYIRVRKQS